MPRKPVHPPPPPRSHGTRVYVRAHLVDTLTAVADDGRPVEIRRYRDQPTGKQWITYVSSGRCVRRIQYAGTSGAERCERDWHAARAEIAAHNARHAAATDPWSAALAALDPTR